LNKGYATAAQVNPWKTAIQKVFETVEGEDWISLDMATIDLDEYVARFRTLAGAQYKAESIATYARRIRNAIDAHNHYLETGRPPSFRQRAAKPKASEEKSETSGGNVVSMDRKQEPQRAVPTQQPVTNGMMDFPYPLGDGRLVTLRLPARLKSDDVTRLCAFIRTLQDDSPEARQIPRRTGEAA
jgi:hypothetical protein